MKQISHKQIYENKSANQESKLHISSLLISQNGRDQRPDPAQRLIV